MDYFRMLVELFTQPNSRNRRVSEYPGQPRVRYTAEERWNHTMLPIPVVNSQPVKFQHAFLKGRVNPGFTHPIEDTDV